MTQRYVVVDLETTGNSVKKGDRIIQFACVVIEGRKIVDEYSTFLNPEQPISPFIEELTGISDEEVRDAPLFSQVAPIIMGYLKDSCFVAHNVLFDLSFLQDELARCGHEGFFGSTIDTVELAKIMRPSASSYKLSHLSKEEGFIHDRPHQADSDAYATAELLLLFIEELMQVPLVTLKHLYRLSYSLKSEISELLSRILQERKSVSPIHHPYLSIHKGIAVRKPDIAKPSSNGQAFVYPFKHEDKIDMLRKAFSQLEIRNDQLAMMDAVNEALEHERIAMIEAETGLGKTLGYLVPAAYYAMEHNQTVMISTYTIQLQNQLLHKELANLRAMLPFPIVTAVMKGRANYISLAKFDRALRTREDNYDSALAKMQILTWLLQTETGDKDELNLTSGGELFWERLQNASDFMNDHQTSWESFDFYERAKRQAESANLVITNHAYLMSDYFSKAAVGKSDGVLIIDEAHQLENAASKHLGSSFDYISIKMMLNKLGIHEQKQLVYKMNNMLSDASGPAPKRRLLNQLLQETMYELEQFFHVLSRLCEEASKGSNGKNVINLQTICRQHNARPLVMLAERLSEYFKKLAACLNENVQTVLGKGTPGKTQLFYLTEIESVAVFLTDNAKLLNEYFLSRKDSVLYWVEWSKNNPSQYVYLYSQPISGGSEMWFRYFSRQKSVVLTSSTLSVKGSFDYMKEKLGLYDERLATYSFLSPFNYKEKVKMLVPTDIPEVSKVSNEVYADSISTYIERAAIASKGRMLVLFTSQEMLKATHESLKASDMLQDFNILSQGISSNSKSRLIKHFQNYDKSILLGTASFWDGLDLPGDTLQCLLIVRLPFSPPTEPLVEARCRLIKEKGGNPFSDYTLPEAIMRFRQGFGRLIRTNEDRGVFIVCDRRITSTSYGRDFIRSIPEVQMEEGDVETIQFSIKSWLQ